MDRGKWALRGLRRSWRVSPVVAVAAVVALVSGAGAAGAATGAHMIIGKSNYETTTTYLSNTKSGAALKLHTRSSSTPNLVVSNHAKISNLNADLLDGHDSGAFNRINKTCVSGNAIVSIKPPSTASCGPTNTSASYYWNAKDASVSVSAPTEVWHGTITVPRAANVLVHADVYWEDIPSSNWLEVSCHLQAGDTQPSWSTFQLGTDGWGAVRLQADGESAMALSIVDQPSTPGDATYSLWCGAINGTSTGSASGGATVTAVLTDPTATLSP